MEIWKDIPGISDYAVSNLGRVKRTTDQSNTYAGRIKSQVASTSGYPTVKIRRKRFFVHVLVMRAFCGIPPKGYETNHKDGNKTNPTLSNLEYVTRQQNVQHAYDIGLISRMGEKNGKSKLTENQVKIIKKILPFDLKRCQIATVFNVHPNTIWGISSGTTWAWVK